METTIRGKSDRSFLWARQLYIILWKNIYVTRLCRHYPTTVLEVALHVVLLLGIQEDSVSREPFLRRGDTEYVAHRTAEFWNMQRDTSTIDTVFFAPTNRYLDLLTHSAMAELGVRHVVAMGSEQQLLNAARQAANSSLPARKVALFYSGVDANNTDEEPVSLHVSFFAGRLPFDLQVRYAQLLISEPEGPAHQEQFPEMNTLLPIVGALQQRHLELQAKRFGYPHPVEKVKLQRFPYPMHLEYQDTKNYALVLTRFCIGMLIPFSVFVARLSDERATGMKEMLRVMGLNDWVYWISHYVSGFFMHLITVTLMMLFISVKRNDEGRAFIQFSDPSLLFWILMCFCSSCLMHAILLSMFFASPHTAVAGAMLYWTFSCVMPFLTLEHAGGQGYHYIQRKHKLWTAIFPGMSLHWSFRVLERFEKFVENGANWSNFYDRAATPDNVTLAEIVLVGILTDFVIMITVWYVDNVLPIGPGIAKSFLFPFKASYWIPAMTFTTVPAKPPQELLNFEPDPTNELAAIDLVNACKDYDGVVAVQDVSMRVFENQITVLLGHNGAGKTTLLNMITGFLDCTSGVVLVGGYDIRTCTRDARDSIGYCAQYNILIDELTVEEHLVFFAILKGIPMHKVRYELVTLVHDVNLMDHREVRAVDLSLGIQRRLCAALAILGKPKVIIMDEPTSNMDPDGRREMWELLLKIRRSCAVFLTTQHLDEADVLGDRIVIMANGRIRCGGSPTFLKQRFGTGYHMRISKLPRCNIAGVEALLKKYAPKAKRQTDSDNEAVFILGQIVATRKIVTMFKDIEQRSEDLGIASVGMTVTSLEDVLIRVGEEHHIHRHHKLPEAPHSDVASLIDSKGTLLKTMASTTASEPTLIAQVWGLLVKRAIYMWRQKKMPLFSWIMPPLLLALLFHLEYISLRGSGRAVQHVGPTLQYKFPEVVDKPQGFIQADSTEQPFLDRWLKPLFVPPFYVVSIDTNVDVTSALLALAKESLYAFVFSTHFGFQMTKETGNVLWYNGQIQHMAPLVTRLYNTARLRNITNVPTAEFGFDVTSRGIEEEREAVEKASKESESIRSQNTYRTLVPKVLRSIFFPLVSSLMCSNFVLFPISERAMQVKHLHMISGMGPLLYWLTNYAFDFTFYIGTAMMVLPPLALIPNTLLAASDVRLIFMLNLLHGYAALPMIYMCSFLFDRPGFGFAVIAIFTFIVSSAGCVGWVFKEHYSEDIESAGLTTLLEVALQVLRLLPSQSYSRGMTKILQLAQENALCQRGGIELQSRCHAGDAKAHLSLWECCMHFDSADPYDYAIQPLDVHPYSAFYDLLTLSIEGVLVFALLICVEHWLPWLDSYLSALEPSAYRDDALYAPRPQSPIGQGIAVPKKASEKHEDTDVLLEDKLVKGLVSGQAILPAEARPFVIVHHLYKAYGYIDSNSVLQGLSFTVRSGECFGLLGVNGVGKTTTFRILTGQLLPHEGDAYVAGFSLVWNTAQSQRYIGYCPQRDGLLDMLTGTETLVLFARLKGVPMSPEYLGVLLDIFHLGEFAEQLVCTFSAGNRRKLSLCVAIMGIPRLLLLDEPYAGIGTTARKRIVSYVNALQKTTKFSILLSSHRWGRLRR